MTDPIAVDGPGLSERSGAENERNLGRRILFIVVGGAVLFFSYLVGAAVVPRWWAQRVGNMVDGSLVAGNTLGFGIGFILTLTPIFVLYMGWRFKKSWKRALGFIVVALVVAAPNLMTLGIVIGSGNAAHAGERILDVDGPGFRGGSLVGAIAAVIVGFVLVWMDSSRRRNKRKASDLKHELEGQ